MTLPIALSKFIIQEHDDRYYLYTEDLKAREIVLKSFVMPNASNSYSRIIRHNEIIINKITYNFLINKCYENDK